MKVAYADPPYLGCCGRYGHVHSGPVVEGCWDLEITHMRLVNWLQRYYPDGWALSLSTPSLRTILEMCPDDVRVAAWVKPFAVYKPNVNPAYAWEPVIWRGGRQPRSRSEMTVRDWFSGPITLKRGLVGAKSEEFVAWMFSLLGVQENDEVTDIFPGTGVVGRTLERQRRYWGLLAEPSDWDRIDATTGLPRSPDHWCQRCESWRFDPYCGRDDCPSVLQSCDCDQDGHPDIERHASDCNARTQTQTERSSGPSSV